MKTFVFVSCCFLASMAIGVAVADWLLVLINSVALIAAVMMKLTHQ